MTEERWVMKKTLLSPVGNGKIPNGCCFFFLTASYIAHAPHSKRDSPKTLLLFSPFLTVLCRQLLTLFSCFRRKIPHLCKQIPRNATNVISQNRYGGASAIKISINGPFPITMSWIYNYRHIFVSRNLIVAAGSPITAYLQTRGLSPYSSPSLITKLWSHPRAACFTNCHS